MSVKINNLEIENVKRVKAVKIEPTTNGLTVIGGKNNQGKTSVLDAISWALGGDRFKPSNPQREGSAASPYLRVELSNGLIVERTGKNSALKVVDPLGNRNGQTLLNSFVEELAINLPKFMAMTSKEKADTLLKIIGVGNQLYQLETKEKEKYNQRRTIGQIAEQKKKYAKELESFPEAPKELVSAHDLIQQQQAILAKNGENARKRDQLDSMVKEQADIGRRIQELQTKLEELYDQAQKVSEDIEIGKKDVATLVDESTDELEDNINQIDEINQKVRINQSKLQAEKEAEDYQAQYDQLSEEINAVRQQKKDLLKGANLPLEGLSVDDGNLIYNGQPWDNMSGSDQLKVSTAIVRKLNPECGFVLVDKLEQMDLETMEEFSKWLESEDLQAIATRVSSGGECQIIIEDGYSKETEVAATESPTWTPGTF